MPSRVVRQGLLVAAAFSAGACAIWWWRPPAPEAPSLPAPFSAPAPAPLSPAHDSPTPASPPPETPAAVRTEDPIATLAALEQAENEHSLSRLNTHLYSRQPDLRAAALDAFLRLGDEKAAPLLRAAARQSLPPEEILALQHAAAFLELPSGSLWRKGQTKKPAHAPVPSPAPHHPFAPPPASPASPPP